jgi:N-acetylglucosamine-6-phosphate deacetylase
LLAGAALPITAGLTHLLRDTECDLRTAVDMASLKPAALVGCAAGRIEIGSPADLSLFHLNIPADRAKIGKIEHVATIRSGRLVWGQLTGVIRG